MLSSALNKQLHDFLTKNNLMEQKANIIYGWTERRTTSSKELTDAECRELLAHLKVKYPGNLKPAKPAQDRDKMVRAVYYEFHQMKWHIPGTEKVDVSRMNALVVRLSPSKKVVAQQSYAELQITLTLVRRYRDGNPAKGNKQSDD